MFVRRSQGLFEFAMAALCLWAAYHHTPLGALLRHGGAKVFGTRTSARSVLAYYSGTGTRGDGRFDVVAPAIEPASHDEALAFAVHEALRNLPREGRGHAEELARNHALDVGQLADRAKGPGMARALVAKLTAELGSEEAAVLAVHVGREAARYAADRVKAEGSARPTLEALARHLPPGFEAQTEAASDTLASGVAFGLGWPVPAGAKISSAFGMRHHPVLGDKRMHTGVDLPLPIGSAVRATGRGVVRRASYDAVNGHVLVVDHGRGVTTAYLHNDALLVKQGELVERGQVISRSGNTGRSTGPHLHYQLELRARPVDPLAYRPR